MAQKGPRDSVAGIDGDVNLKFFNIREYLIGF